MTNEDDGRVAAESEQGPGTAPEVGATGGRGRGAEAAPAHPDPEAGLATAEYAVATVAAVGFAGLLIAVLKSDTVRGLLENIISSALSV
ncbi:DUF4244 domain-containing protein [Isoptericola sp. NPDC056605]|uniref:DUF4244 domain-containing protein n=1 Tax=Isoptericola sp. NPDC056605 TaxID=3345876 RepID=UPI0036A586B7